MTSKVPILGIIGKNEVENGEITIRRLGSEENKTYKFEEFFALLKLEAQI